MSDKTTYPIPRGWRRVTRGRTHEGDKVWCPVKGVWIPMPYVGREVDGFYCVIRRVGKGGAG